jgi:hypothetical protein
MLDILFALGLEEEVVGWRHSQRGSMTAIIIILVLSKKYT